PDLTGADAASLAPAPLDRLDLPEAVVTTLRRWGIADLGALAALPRDALATRLGPDGLRAHDLASGVDSAPFHPWTPPPFWEEAQGLDWEVHDLLALGAVLDVALSVRPVVARPGQGGLWQPPAMAERDLAALLARLVRLVGPDNVGSPAVDDSHRPDAITLDPFSPPDSAVNDADATTERPLALRRLRPPPVVTVAIADERPARVP